jgi:hypothetical protein
MVNYKSRNTESGGSIVAGALKLLDEYESENPKNPPAKASYDNDLYRDSESNYKEMFGSGFTHQSVISHLLTKTKPHHFHLLRATARHLLDTGGGGLLGKDEATFGALNDIANARNLHHLVDMVHNDMKMGGDLSGGSFLDVLKSIGNGIVSVGKVALPLLPVLAKGASMLL